MKSSVQSKARKDAQTAHNKDQKEECALSNDDKSKGNKDEMSTNNEYASPNANLNKKRNRTSSLSRSSSSSLSSSPKKDDTYWSKLRKRGKETSKKKGDNISMTKAHYCHHCGELVFINKTLKCSMPQCDENYCFNCVKTSYISFLDKTPLTALKKLSNNNKWHCFKCCSKCLCLRCIPGSKKKTITQPIPHEVFIHPSNTLSKGYKQLTTFKTELVNKEPEQESLNSNEIGCKILKIKDEALIQSLHSSKSNMSNMMPITAYEENSNRKSKKKSKKKKKQNTNKHEAHSPKTKALEELKVQDEKIQQLVKQCEGYFYEQSKKKSFLKKTCLSCKGQCFNTNEILNFRYLKDFLSYVNYLFTYQPILIYNTEIANINKEILHDDMKELNGAKNKEDWHFSQPKVLCKGCLMILLNKYDGIEILRSILMDNKDKKQECSDKEKEIEQENEIKLQTKDINETIAREIQLKKEKKEEKQISNQNANGNVNINANNGNANVFDKVFNMNQIQPSTLNSVTNQSQVENKQIESRQQQNIQREQVSTANSNSIYLQTPVYIPDVFPQYFQSYLNDLILYFNQLITEAMALNQQYQTTILTKETISSFCLMIEGIIKRNHNKEQEIIQIMFNCKTMLFAFMNYLHYLYSFSPTNDNSLIDSLRKTKEMFEYEFGAYNEIMNKILQAMEFYRKLSFDYLENLKMQYYILDRLSMR